MKYLESYKSKISDYSMNFTIIKFTDDSRYYIRSNDEVFNKLFREIAIPYISILEISKDDLEYKFILKYEKSNLANSTLNEETSSITLIENIIYFGSREAENEHHFRYMLTQAADQIERH